MSTTTEERELSPGLPEKPHWIRLLCASFAYMTVQLSFGFVFALFTPLLTDVLELPLSWSPVIWCIGPLTGLLQPLLGSWSDLSQMKWGRRRPFILGGALIILVGYILFYFVEQIGNALGDRNHFHPAGITIAITAMIILNIAINVVMGPARAIVCDLSQGGREALGNSMISLMIGAANLISNMVVFAVTSSTTPFIIGVILVSLSVLPTLFFAKERPFKRAPGVSANPFKRILLAFKTMRGPVLRACIVFFLSWAAYFPFSTNATTYVGACIYNRTVTPHAKISMGIDSPLIAALPEVVPAAVEAVAAAAVPVAHNKIVLLAMAFALPGNPMMASAFSPASRPLFQALGLGESAFEEGKRVGAAAIAAMSLVTALFSAISNWLMNLIGLKVTYFVAQLIATGAYVGLFFATTTTEVFIYFCLIGLNFSLFNSVPFALVSECVGEADAGLYAGAKNIFCVGAQLVSLIVNSIISAIWPNNLEVVMMACAILSLIATALVPILKRGNRAGVPAVGADSAPHGEQERDPLILTQ